jgi:phage terminase large subunit-like protein
MIELMNQYIDDVMSGEELSCNYVRLAVQRHVDDLKRDDIYFDKDAAFKAINFFKYQNHYKGDFAGKPFELLPYQCFITGSIFGWKRKDTGTRRFKTANIEIPRKIGKTTWAAGIGNYMLRGDGEPGAEVYTAATTRQQAKICFTDARAMVLKSPKLSTNIEVQTHNMHIVKTASKFEYVSSDYGTLDGLNPHCGILDETHAYKTSGLYDIFISAMGARSQPLLIIITTAGFNKTWWYYREQRKSIVDILEGRITDDSVFGIIYTLDEGDNWQDEEVWKKAMPSIGVTPTYENIRERVQDAKNKPSQRVNVLTKHFNIFTDASKTWIPSEKWKELETETPDLTGLVGYGGLDLANTRDIAAYSVCIPLPDGRIYLKRFLFIPEDNAYQRQESEGVPYADWLEAGHLIGTPGNSIDYNAIKKVIYEYQQEVELHSIAIDSWNSTHFRQEMQDEMGQMYVKHGGKMQHVERINPFGQGFRSMSDPTKLYESLLLDGNVVHDGNPVMEWMIGNVELARDPAGNIKPDKGKSSEKIDGVIADIMAIGEWQQWGSEATSSKSVYEGRAARTF